MEHHDPSRRQYAPNPYTATQTQPVLAPLSGQYATAGNVERFRQSGYLQEPPATPPSAGRVGDAQQVYGFAQGAQYGASSAMQASTMQYGQEMQTPESQRQPTQQQSYQQYGSHVYGMGPPQPAQSPYDPVPQYRSRANTSETMASQFGVAPAGQYYLPGQANQPSTSVPELQTQLPSQYVQSEPYAQPGPSTSPSYATTMMDPTQSGQYPGYVQQSQYQPQPQSSIDQGIDRYQNQIRAVFTNVHEGMLQNVASQLVDASSYLLGSVEQLGLTRDDRDLYRNRLNLWQEFNAAWLTSLQRQFDMTQEILRTNAQPRDPQSIMSVQSLEHMGNELTRLCDIIEKHGLVDYEMGVEEDMIMDLLLQCLSLLEPREERGAERRVQAESSVAAAMRGR